jgi:dipeptidyl aminopeptidase/acylaminoacyl peptidase
VNLRHAVPSFLILSLAALSACRSAEPSGSAAGSAAGPAQVRAPATASVTPTAAAQQGPPHHFSVTDMLAMERISELAASPDGQRLAFTLRTTDMEANRGRTDLWLHEADGSLRALTSHEASDTSAQWSPDGRAVYFLSSRSGSSQVWRVAADGGKAEQVTDFPVDVSVFVLFEDGERLAFAADVYPDAVTLQATADRDAAQAASKVKARVYDDLLFRHWDSWEDGKRSHVFVWSPGGGAPVDLMPGWDADCPTHPFGGVEDIAVSPDGATVVFAAKKVGREAAWSTNVDLWSARSDGASPAHCLTTTNFQALDGLPVFSPDGGTLAYVSMARPGYESDRLQVRLLDLKTGALRKVAAGWDRSPGSLAWSADGRQLIVDADDLGHHNLFALDIASDTVRALTATAYNGDAEPVAHGLYFLRDDLSHAAEIHFLALDAGAPRPGGADAAVRLTHVNDARLAQARMGEYEQFTFAGAKGETVHAWLVKPADFDPAKKYPVVLLIHGGPQGSMGNHFHYRWNAQAFAGAGLAAIMIDFHGSTGYGQAFCDSIRGDWGGAPYEDLMKGLDHALATYPFLDGTRAAAAGGSYGGFMVNWIQGQTTRFKALVAHSGNLDERMAYYDTEELWFPEWDHQGVPWEHPDGYAKHNPIDHVAKWRTPQLVIHGALDYRVVDTQGMSVFTALQRRGIPSRFLYFPDENHWILKPQNSELWYGTVLRWLRQWLGNDVVAP